MKEVLTMGSKAKLVARVASQNNITKKDASKIVDSVFDGVMDLTVEDGSFSLIGFGSFSVRERAARKGRNPQTGETITIPAKKAIYFKVGKGFKDSIK